MNKSEPKKIINLALPKAKEVMSKFSIKWTFGQKILVKWLGLKIFSKKLKKNEQNNI